MICKDVWFEIEAKTAPEGAVVAGRAGVVQAPAFTFKRQACSSGSV